MKVSYFMIIACVALGLTGCVSRVSMPYVMKTERVDQQVDIGNRGYLQGTPPPPTDRGGLKRPFIAVDVDLIDMKVGAKSKETK